MTIRVLLLACLAFFSTGTALGQGLDQVLLEDFDGVTAPELPPGWTTTDDAWETHTSSESPGSGINNLYNRGSGAGMLTLPPVDLTGAMTAELTYLARRTKSYDPANLQITASLDGGTSFPIVVASGQSAMPTSESTYEAVSIALPAAVLGAPSVILRIETLGVSASTANVRLDDVGVTAMRLVIVNPTALSFLAMAGSSDSATFTLANADASSLQVNAPVVGGAYTVSPAGPITVPAGESQTYTVTWSPTMSGVDNRTLLLVHEHGNTSIALEGRTAGGIFGFQVDSANATPGDSLHLVPMRLEFADEAGLQGLQFRVEWSDSTVRFRDVVRGDAITDSTEWTLSYEADSVAATVVLLGSGTTALAPGTMDSLLSLRFALPDSVQEASIRFGLSEVVGALGVAGGDDAGLAVRPDSHFVSLEAGEANFLASATTLDLERVAVGDTAIAELTVSNPAGSIPLVVYPVTANVPAFSVEPDSVVVPPDSSVSVTVRFAPSDTLFGALEASVVFVHNGVTGSDTLRVQAMGEGGRGDVARDGVVDVVDLVQALDFVLLRGEPDSLQVRSADLNPFPEGNGELDVRDLTVLSHGIVNGMWPDSIALPVLGSEPEMSPSLIAEGAGERSESIVLNATWTLTLETDIPVRALQAVLRARDVASVRATSATKETSGLVTLFTQTQSEVRVLAYRADGGLLEAGKYQLLEVEPEGNGALVTPVYVIGVDEALKRVPVAVAGFGGGSDEGEVPGESLRLGVPYPNPVRFSEGERLRLPLASRPSDGRGRAAVFNVLGQRVRNLPLPNEDESILEWDGRDEHGGHVAPGIYFIRLEGVTAPVRSAVVLR